MFKMPFRGIGNSVKSFMRASFSTKNLFVTNTLTSGVLLAGGDVIEQKIEKSLKKINKFDQKRTGIVLKVGDLLSDANEKVADGADVVMVVTHSALEYCRMFFVGLSQGPPHHYWYTFLDRMLPKRDLKTVLLKILADQVVAAPTFAILFFYGMGILQDKRLSECWVEFALKFPMVYLFDWCIWPPTQYVNFVWIPSRYRVVYVNFVTVVWDVFLSYIKHYDERDPDDPRESPFD